jgi:hypothetical protein
VAVLSEAIQRFVREQRLGYVATVSPDGMPNVSPKGSLTVLDVSNLVFADVESPHTIRNLEKNPHTEVNVVDPFLRKGYRFRGRATILHTGISFWKVLEMYRAEGADVRRIRAVVVIEVAEVLPLVSPVYLVGRVEEEDVRARWEEYYRSAHQRSQLDLVPPHEF